MRLEHRGGLDGAPGDSYCNAGDFFTRHESYSRELSFNSVPEHFAGHLPGALASLGAADAAAPAAAETGTDRAARACWPDAPVACPAADTNHPAAVLGLSAGLKNISRLQDCAGAFVVASSVTSALCSGKEASLAPHAHFAGHAQDRGHSSADCIAQPADLHQRPLSWAHQCPFPQSPSTRGGRGIASGRLRGMPGSSARPLPGDRLLPRAGPDDWERWDLARRSGPALKNQCGRGRAQGCTDALEVQRSLLVVSRRPDCRALVDLKVARRHAKQAKRPHLAPGDGCASAICSDDFRRARFAKRQQKYADELGCGDRILVRWPANPRIKNLWIRDAATTATAAAEARAAVDTATPGQG